MTKNSKDLRSNCPINSAVETFGDKWTLLVIRDLMFKGKRHYSDFLAPDEKTSTHILADRLQKLDDNGVITKSTDPENASKFIYSLTEKGQALLPAMEK
jgi:DNA-binding HxlR family transcriptional regulator